MSVLRKVKGKVDFMLWKMTHPGRPFHEYYVNDVKKRINKEHGHPTLGKTRSNDTRFKKTAEIEVAFLKKEGLQKNSVFVDYGCGSLRLGRILIPYLDTANYSGLDMTDVFYKNGIEQIGEEIIENKKVYLNVINEESIGELRKREIDFIFSSAVLYHIPQKELKTYFSNVISLMNPHTRAYIDFTDSSEYKQPGKTTWLYPASMILDILGTFDVKTTLLSLGKEDAKHYPEGHTILKLEKAGTKE